MASIGRLKAAFKSAGLTDEQIEDMDIQADHSLGGLIKTGAGKLGDMWDDVTGVTSANQQSDAAAAALDSQEAAAAAGQGFIKDQATLGAGYIDQATGQAEGALGTGASASRDAINTGGNRLSDLYGGGLAAGFETDPGYQFRLSEGMRAINQSAAARGGRMGGDTLKALQEHGQNFASNEFNNYANRTMGMAQGADQSDAQRQASLANIEGQYGTSLANLYSGAATNKANNAIGAGGQVGSLSSAMMGAYNNPVQYAGAAANARGNAYGAIAGGIAGGLYDAWSRK